MNALRYIARISAVAASGLLETLVPRRKSPGEQFFAMGDALEGDLTSRLPKLGPSASNRGGSNTS